MKRKKKDNRKELRELCKRCYEWVDEEEAELTNDIPHCIHGYDPRCQFYQCGTSDTCPHFNEW